MNRYVIPLKRTDAPASRGSLVLEAANPTAALQRYIDGDYWLEAIVWMPPKAVYAGHVYRDDARRVRKQR